MKIGIFGNCQVQGLSHCLSALAPGLEIVAFSAARAKTVTDEQLRIEVEKLKECDVVLYQPTMHFKRDGLKPEDIEAFDAVVLPYPVIATTTLHPDCHYCTGPDGHVKGPMGSYQSAIVAGAYQCGLDTFQAAGLFNTYTYRKLGYLKPNNQRLLDTSARYGYDMSEFTSGAHGVYMHTINHPAIKVSHAIALNILERLDIKEITDPDTIPEDPLISRQIWPVYPGLSHANVDYCDPMVFRWANNDIHMSLPEFVEASYTAFTEAGGYFNSILSHRVTQFIRTHVIS